MKDYLLDIMHQKETGLYLCELPTGNGKTYASAQAMKEFADTITDGKKIIYLTTLNKNLPEEALKTAYGNEDAYNHNVLRIRSNFDEVTEKILELEIPEEMKTDNYWKLCKDVSLYKQAVEKRYADREYVDDLVKRINEGERKFRAEITRLLKRSFPGKIQRKNAIRTDRNYQWIGRLYPAVFTEDYKILLMSVSKFMKKNSVLIEQSYEFLKSKLIQDAVIIMDEFDATKNTIQSELIEKSLTLKAEYIPLFRQIYRNLNVEDLSREMTSALTMMELLGGRYEIGVLVEEAEQIANDYHINLSIKTTEEQIDQMRNFLFHDGSFHTVLNGGAQYIRATREEKYNRIQVYFENKEQFYKNRNTEQDIVLYSLLRDIGRFLEHFRAFVLEWGKFYMGLINTGRKEHVDRMTLENAVSSILKKLGLSEQQCELLMGERCPMVHRKREVLLEDRSFYQIGMEYYEFEDNDSHHDNTEMNYIKVYDTPEKILLYLSQKATVFGVSATGEMDSVVGNYDLGYLEEQLKDRYHCTSIKLKNRTKNELEKRWEPYRNGEIRIHGECIQSNLPGFQAEEYCKTFMDPEFARYAAKVISNTTDKEYQILRYCNILKVMCRFFRTKDIQSLLYLGMALPKRNEPGMDESVLLQLFEYAKQNAEESGGSLFFLKGENFEDDKSELQERLATGEKIFVMSSYQTIGAGQNLQYRIPEGRNVVQLGEFDEHDQRFLYKDFDALYLGNITHLTVNTYQREKISAHDLLQMLFQVEELYENDELDYPIKDQALKLAFHSFSGTEIFMRNQLYATKSVIVRASQLVLQAVGRVCRTFVKSPNIYLFIESELLEKLYVGELKKRILPPEMEVILSMRETLGKDYQPVENLALNKAERISSRGMWTIRKMLSKGWTREDMQAWEQLRTLVLQYPTASASEWERNDYLKKYYITSGEKQNQYLYSQYSDFNDVTIDFGNDKVAFRNSSRAKKKGNSEEVAVYEMSERESGLQRILKYPGIKEHFQEMGYATEFEQNEYLMSPVLFHNIYKGALGEAAGAFILQKELGIELKPITDPKQFEFFDYEMSDGVYVDFKNWKFTYVQEKNKIYNDIRKKMTAINARRVYIINVVSDKNYKPSISQDQSIVEIPMLIREDGTVCYENLHMICKEDFERVDK